MSYTLQPGDRVNGYEIKEVIGSGGFGVTYRATDLNHHQDVAIKEYFPTIAVRGEGSHRVRANSQMNQKEFNIGLNRFRQESEMLARFSHISIVRILTVFEANSTAYMVMEYEHGRDLNRHIAQLQRPLSYKEIIDIFIPLLDGLRAMHRENILHLDIKPDNIFIRTNSTPCLIDFGGARHHAAQDSRLIAKKVSFMVAADGFSPPEQYSNDNKTKGPWSDIYAMGATIYSCLDNGRTPPGSQERYGETMNDKPDPLEPATKRFKNKYPHDLLELIDRCLSHKRQERPQDALEMQDILISIANKEAVTWEKKDKVAAPVQPPKTKKKQATQTPSSNEVKPKSYTNNNRPRGPYAPPPDNKNLVYAGFWMRTAALLLDTILLFIIWVSLILLSPALGIDLQAVLGSSTGFFSPLNMTLYILPLIYFAGMESSAGGGTFGKRAVRIRVVDENGQRITFGKAVGRYLGKILSGLLFLFGYLMAGFTRRKQGLHDMMSGTLVIQKL